MAIVSYRARDAFGTAVKGQLDAASLVEAQRILSARGLRDFVWLSEAVVPDLDGKAAREEFTVLPDELTSWWRIVSSNWWLWAIVGFVWGKWVFRPAGPLWLAVALTVGAAFAFFVLILPVNIFRRFQHHKKWRELPAARRCLAQLRFSNAFLRLKVLAWAYDFEEARILAMEGRLDDALAVVAKHSGTDPPRYKAQLIGVYENARRYDEALRVARESAEARANDASAWLDVARLLVHRFRDLVGAREALARAEGSPLSQFAQSFRKLVLGMVLIEERSAEAALGEIDGAIPAFAATAKHTPNGFVELARLYRARALAQQGKMAAAELELAMARPMFAAQGQTEMLALVEAEIDQAR